MLCCPSCGHTTIDPNRSRAARGLMRLFGRRSRTGPEQRATPAAPPRRGALPRRAGGHRVVADHGRRGRTLRDLPVGSRGRVCEFAAHTPPRCREALTAYGVCPGQWLCVLRTSPVTVVEVDQLELALEGDLAELIELDQLECPDCPR